MKCKRGFDVRAHKVRRVTILELGMMKVRVVGLQLLMHLLLRKL